MKLLKYAMTVDSGLAPNPYFRVCSLALCTPNHMNARLEAGDWVIGHSTAATGRRLVYAMHLTRVLGMNEYFQQYPDKRPDPLGTVERQHGDNMYFQEGGRWIRLPSSEHNDPDSFLQDQDRRVYLAEGENSYWYFGAANAMTEIADFAERFPSLIQTRQGFSYVRDRAAIDTFVGWLSSLGKSGVLGKPRDQKPLSAPRYIKAVSPLPEWHEVEAGSDQGRVTSALNASGCGICR